MIKISNENNNVRVDKFLAEELEFSRSTIQKMIVEGLVLVNGESVKANYKLKTDDQVEYSELPETNIEVLPVNIPIKIVYEDEDVIVVDKESGMVVHPAHGHYDDTLVNALLYHIKDLSTINGVKRPGIVHRIDKDTSGLLMIAKNDKAHQNLSSQLQDKLVERKYITLVHGVIPHEFGKINAPIGRDANDRKKMATVEGGKEAVTHFKVIERFEEFTLVECRLETGRTHQIRVHMKFVGYPVVGDPIYGRRKVIGKDGQFLHAQTLGFDHPSTGEYMEFESELPLFFTTFLNDLRRE